MEDAAPKWWVIFDADNTLWHLEPLYDDARTRMCDYVSELSGVPAREIETYQRARDKDLNAIYGYSAARFARSFEDTICHFFSARTTEQIRHARAMAERVFAQKADFVEDAEVVLRSLHAAGFHLGLLTAGEAWVQQKRISEFHLQGIFHAVDVVEKKTAREFKAFCDKHGIDAESCYAIGDSKASEIEPATSVGLRAILVPHANWVPVEGAVEPDQLKYTEVKRLRDVLNVIGVKPLDSRPRFLTDIRCYGIFEGGGARGLGHIGALKACEERKICFAGVAGTSAGAIVAGLVAAGYSADELFSPERTDGGCIFDRDYIALLGQHEWYRAAQLVDKIQGHLDNIGQRSAVPERFAQSTPIIRGVMSLLSTVPLLYHWIKLGHTIRSAAPLARDLGYFSSAGFQEWYNAQLARKLGKDAGQTITFADIPFDLRIVSADLRNSRMIIHSRATYPDRSVAEAVAASISIPIVFKPKSIGADEQSELHVDGGMLSNFPAWVFTDADTHIPVLGFELVSEGTILQPRPDFFSFLRALLDTAISGKKGLETRGILDIHFVSIPVSVGTFRFDVSAEERRQTYLEGATATRDYFRKDLQLVPHDQMAPFLYEAYRRILERVNRPVHLRVNVMDRNSVGHLSIRYQYNMEFDSDDRMDLPLDAGGAGQCYTGRTPVIVDLYRAKREFSRFRMSKYAQALVRTSLRSLLSVPIFLPQEGRPLVEGPVIGVLNFDSDDLTADELRPLTELAMDISSMISYVWVELAERGEVRR